MPSIQDVADQINARLNLIVTNTQNTAQNTADIRNELQQANAQLGQIENTLAVGLANISQGLFGLLQVQLAAFAELEQNRKQNDTIICELVNANELLCNIMRKAGKLVVLGEATLTSVKRIEGVAERVHASEAGDYDRDLKLQEKIDLCCPPPEPPPEPCPERCPVSSFEPPHPRIDWKPLPTPEQPPRVG